MTPTTQTNQPDDRCEQIAREILSEWKSAHKPPEDGMGFVAIFPEHWEDLAKRYGTALQAAKQQGLEEGEARCKQLESEIEKLKRAINFSL